MQYLNPEIIVQRHLTPKELAARWRWHPESIRRFCRQGRVATVTIGRRKLIPIAAVEALELAGRDDGGLQ